jgi:hypothetical protein
MRFSARHRLNLLLMAAMSTMQIAAQAQTPSAHPAGSTRDGSRDFDFEIGTWKTHLRRLTHPLSGSTTWLEYDGATVVRRVWNGAANLVELEVSGPAGHIGALSLRLYDPASHQWNLNFANRAVGQMSFPPTIGAFNGGRGEFFDEEEFNGRKILVRFVIFNITTTSCQFEQAYSDDGGKSWEVNWVATDTRVGGPRNPPRDRSTSIGI